MTKIVIDTVVIGGWLKKLARYMINRLRESSTLRGIIVALTVLGWKFAPPEHVDSIVTLGTLVFSAIHALLPDQLSPKPPEQT